MSIETLFEVTQSKNPRIDAEKGIIHDVRILGPKSANGRVYTPEAIRNAVGLYESRAVFTDHPKRSASREDRPIKDKIGWLQNVREHDSGLNGDLHILKSHSLAATILEAAERAPNQFGLSHNAEGRTVQRDGKTFVEEIKAVRSVDIVSDPATTRGLFESMNTEPEPEPIGMKTTLGQLLESLAPKSEDAKAWSKLLEEDLPAVSDAPVVVAGDAPSAEDQVHAAFKAMVVAVLDDKTLDLAGQKKKIGEILNAKEKLADKPADETPAAAPADMPESVQAKINGLQAQLDVRGLADKAGVILSEAKIRAMVGLNAADRNELITEAKLLAESTGGKPPRKPDSSGRPLQESDGDFVEPKDTKEFVESITG
jgi:hypothetical protein